MSKSWKGNKTSQEFTKVQKLAHANKQLKNEIARLRKTIYRMNSGWCPGCLVKYEEEGETQNLPEPSIEEPKIADRTCYKCKQGQLRIVKYYKLNETYYFRKCEKCPHRTAGKKWTSDVKE